MTAILQVLCMSSVVECLAILKCIEEGVMKGWRRLWFGFSSLPYKRTPLSWLRISSQDTWREVECLGQVVPSNLMMLVGDYENILNLTGMLHDSRKL
ncbi:hypothetical protein IFM89_038941 [Coptis chinensis]|uniref:Uncharacterized protein n=1 Tax=Coptis chinensis TaxID=261450 RepID=A0A835LXX5_9MAGN|nr:hypothetical protein IFM89_038941 [Coptis chinensis]